jgi:hypothetical protein
VRPGAIRSIVLGVLLASTLAAGCGGGSKPKTPQERQQERRVFLNKANGLCTQFRSEQNEVQFPSGDPTARTATHAQRAVWGLALKRIVDIGRREIKALRELEPPEELRVRYAKVVTTLEDAFNGLSAAAEAGKRNRPAQIESNVARARADLDAVSKLANAMGLPGCA